MFSWRNKKKLSLTYPLYFLFRALKHEMNTADLGASSVDEILSIETCSCTYRSHT